ncbi:bromodomain-containing factor 1, partial [Kwoniella heveanensis BCC8398]
MSVPQAEAPTSTPPPPPPAVSEPLTPQPPAEANPATETAPAPVSKPLLNPLQSEASAPASTAVEPPRSPNPANPATDDQGNTVTEGVNGHLQPAAASSSAGPSATPTPAPVTSASVVEQEEPSRSPLPPDATVPPTPRAEDEAPPPLPAGAIPSAVPTPSVITTEDLEKQGGILGVEASSLPTPAPEEPASVAPSPVAASAPVAEVAEPKQEQETAGDPMDVDAKGEEEAAVPESSGLQASASDGSLKRAGESLEPGREEKRMKEESPAVNDAAAVPPTAGPVTQATSTPAPAASSSTPLPPANSQAAEPSVASPAPPADAPPPAWLSYQPPAPRPSGPTTPLTQHQHKHLLNAVRGLKKRTPDAAFFTQPVDTVLFNIPHYPQIIETPMDLGTVETKLIVSDPRGPPKDKSKMAKWDTSKGVYTSYSEVVTDVRTIWENSRKFNGKEHGVTQAADRLDSAFETALSKIPPEPTPVVATPPTPVAPPPAPAAAAGPSARRASISQPPVIRRSSDDARPKREIHPPPSKDLAYEETAGAARKPKRRNDPQLQWANRTIKALETSQKFYTTVQPFLYPVEQIIEQLPDYGKFIKRPIDLNHITEKLAASVYEEFQQVDDDIRLMISNAMKFNPPGHEVNTAANHFLQIWEEKLKGLPAKQEARDSSEDPLAEEFVEPGYSSEEDGNQLRTVEAQVSALNEQVATLRAKIAKRRATKASKPTKAKAPKA